MNARDWLLVVMLLLFVRAEIRVRLEPVTMLIPKGCVLIYKILQFAMRLAHPSKTHTLPCTRETVR